MMMKGSWTRMALVGLCLLLMAVFAISCGESKDTSEVQSGVEPKVKFGIESVNSVFHVQVDISKSFDSALVLSGLLERSNSDIGAITTRRFPDTDFEQPIKPILVLRNFDDSLSVGAIEDSLATLGLRPATAREMFAFYERFCIDGTNIKVLVALGSKWHEGSIPYSLFAWFSPGMGYWYIEESKYPSDWICPVTDWYLTVILEE